MTKADRNNKIVLHLRQRFQERHGVELTRDRRLMLLQQIKSGVQAKRLFRLTDDKFLYRVYLYSNERMCNLPYTVIYCQSIDQILTVLPSKDSEEYARFLEKYGLDRSRVEGREMTAKERTAMSVENAKVNIAEVARNEKVAEGLRRLKAWKGQRKYFPRKLLTIIGICDTVSSNIGVSNVRHE